MKATLKNIISLAHFRLGISEDSASTAWLELEANETIRQLNIFETYCNVCANLKVDSCNRVELPDNFYEMGCLRANACCPDPENPNETANINATFYFLNQSCLQSWGVNSCNPNQPQCFTGSYDINGNTIDLVGRFTNLTNVILAYNAYQVDSRGYFVNQPKDLESAVAYRICHSYMMLHAKDYDAYSKQWYDAKAVAMFNMVRAKSARRVLNRSTPQMLSIVNAIIINKNFVGKWGNGYNGYGG